MTDAKRDDGGKLRWHLIPVPALVAFCKVWHAGGLKYGDENWRQGLSYSRIYRPMISHLNKWLCSKSSYDKELGTHHLLMVAWGCFVLYMYEVVLKLPHLDNRPDRGTLTDADFEYEDPLVSVGEKENTKPILASPDLAAPRTNSKNKVNEYSCGDNLASDIEAWEDTYS